MPVWLSIKTVGPPELSGFGVTQRRIKMHLFDVDVYPILTQS